jgi:hypothetical protein
MSQMCASPRDAGSTARSSRTSSRGA